MTLKDQFREMQSPLSFKVVNGRNFEFFPSQVAVAYKDKRRGGVIVDFISPIHSCDRVRFPDTRFEEFFAAMPKEEFLEVFADADSDYSDEDVEVYCVNKEACLILNKDDNGISITVSTAIVHSLTLNIYQPTSEFTQFISDPDCFQQTVDDRWGLFPRVDIYERMRRHAASLDYQ